MRTSSELALVCEERVGRELTILRQFGTRQNSSLQWIRYTWAGHPAMLD